MSDNLLLIYEYVADMGERRGPYRASHLEHIKSAQAAGQIGLAGATGDPPDGGAIQFTGVTAQDVEEWVASDPYGKAGLVLSHKILPWNLV
jgi:uncharacterized protein